MIDAQERRILFRYLVSGGLASAVQFAILIALVELTRADPTQASVIGFCAAVVINYNLQYHWTFGAAGAHSVIFLRYSTITFAMLGLNTALFWMMHEHLGIDYVIAQLVTKGFVLVINFTVNRHYTFTAAVARKIG